MTFTYGGNLAASNRDQVRFLVGDADSTEVFLQDEEIDWLIAIWLPKGSIYYPAAMACEAIAAKFAREVTTTSDSQTVGTSELQQKYMELAARLMRQHETLLTGGEVSMGGVNAGEQPDPTVTSPAFGTGMHDYIEAGNQDRGDQAAYLSPEWEGWYR